MGIVEWIGLISGLMAIIGLPGILELVKWSKISNNRNIDRSKIIEKEINNFEKIQSNVINSNVRFKINKSVFHIPSSSLPNNGYLIEVLIPVLMLTALFIVSFFSEHYKTYFDLLSLLEYNSLKWIFVWLVTYIILSLVVLFLGYIVYDLLLETSKLLKEKRKKYYSFFFDKLMVYSTIPVFSAKENEKLKKGENYIITYLGSKEGVLDYRYRELLPCIFDVIKILYLGKGILFFYVKISGSSGLFNADGHMVLPVIYDKVLSINVKEEIVLVYNNKDFCLISSMGMKKLSKSRAIEIHKQSQFIQLEPISNLN